MVLFPGGRLGSLGVQFGLILFVLCLPLGVLQVWQYLSITDTVQRQVAETQQNYLRLYQESIDRTLDTGAKLVEALSGEPWSDQVSRQVRLVSSLNGVFAYDPVNLNFRSGSNLYVDDQERQAVHAWLIRTDPVEPAQWVPATTDQGHFLVYRTVSGSQVWGAWVDVDQFLQPLYLIDSGQDSASFYVVDGQAPFPPSGFLTQKKLSVAGAVSGTVVGSREHYLYVDSPSRSGEFSLGVVMPEARYLRHLPSFFLASGLVSVTTLVILVLFVMQFRRLVLRPLGLLTSAMGQVGEDPDARIDFSAGSSEIALIRDTFNAMVERIHTLKITVYEEKLHSQEGELNFLQLQLNPHFFLNSLNILYQLAEVPNLPLLQELLVRLSKYFRFMHNGGATFVSLAQEMEHTENYFEIQAVRFPDRLKFYQEHVDVPSDTPVPPLLIHTFVENSIKYGMHKDRSLALTVMIRRVTPTRIVIRIEDNGPGFPEPILDQLRKGQRILGPDREHIGINNVRRRLKLLYADKAAIACFNSGSHGGAVVEITIPVPHSL